MAVKQFRLALAKLAGHTEYRTFPKCKHHTLQLLIPATGTAEAEKALFEQYLSPEGLNEVRPDGRGWRWSEKQEMCPVCAITYQSAWSHFWSDSCVILDS